MSRHSQFLRVPTWRGLEYTGHILSRVVSSVHPFPPKTVLGMTLNCIWWWGSSSGSYFLQRVQLTYSKPYRLGWLGFEVQAYICACTHTHTHTHTISIWLSLSHLVGLWLAMQYNLESAQYLILIIK